MTRAILIARLVLGLWMLANGTNHFFVSMWAEPMGQEPLAMQLMAAFVHSGLIDVAYAIELACGALLLVGVWVPAALCVLMPVSTCALYWAAVLEHQAAPALLALTAFALNGLLMLATLDAYRGALQRRALALGEA